VLQHGPAYEKWAQMSLLPHQFVLQNFLGHTEILPMSLVGTLGAELVDQQELPQLEHETPFCDEIYQAFRINVVYQ
jgi:hypothetical protein